MSRDWKNTPVIKRWLAVRQTEGAALRAAGTASVAGLWAALSTPQPNVDEGDGK